MSVDYITKLDVRSLFEKVVEVRANGQCVYRGDDPSVANRWMGYFVNRTPWPDIYASEDRLRRA